MSANYDEKANTWTSQFYYTDYTGTRKKKKKRGFLKKREALDWERTFLEKQQADLSMIFSSLIALYLEDMGHRLRESTITNKRYIIDLKIVPSFGTVPVNQIKPTDIRKWQNKLMTYKDDKGKPYSQTYLKTINNQIVAIFNYAVKYYGLRENPCHKAGSMGKKDAEEMAFWTTTEFNTFKESVEDKPHMVTAFTVLYYTGVRIGELLALTVADIDLVGGFITVNKSLQRLNKRDVITPPKTPKSNRVITIPPFLCTELEAYMEKLYGMDQTAPLFPFSKSLFGKEITRGCCKCRLKRIRVHDLRHSHASLLIDLGFPPLLIAERLGHEKVETTLNTYGHLYPNKHGEVAQKLELLENRAILEP